MFAPPERVAVVAGAGRAAREVDWAEGVVEGAGVVIVGVLATEVSVAGLSTRGSSSGISAAAVLTAVLLTIGALVAAALATVDVELGRALAKPLRAIRVKMIRVISAESVAYLFRSGLNR